jgi:hypothetical protein
LEPPGFPKDQELLDAIKNHVSDNRKPQHG